jgi:hypothetical protein
MVVAILVLLGLILSVSVASFAVVVMIQAKVNAYHRLNGDDGPPAGTVRI